MDKDSDDYGANGNFKCLCGPAGNYTATKGGDCNDDNGEVNPDAIDLCDYIDNNCSDGEDEDYAVGQECDGIDEDFCANGTYTCSGDGTGVVCLNEDPEDLVEVCGGGSEDCDGEVDEADAVGCKTYYKNDDDDAFGLDGDSKCLCEASGAYNTLQSGDCDDSNTEIYPGAKVCGEDGDCDLKLPDVGEECDDGNVGNWDGCQECTIAEYQVNQFTIGDQTMPGLVQVENKGPVVVWYSNNQNGQGWDLYGRSFSTNGGSSDEFKINSEAVDHESYIGIAASGNKFLAAWRNDEGVGIVGRVYAHPNVAKTNVFEVGPGKTPAVAGLANSGFIVFWQPLDDNPELHQVVGQRYTQLGTPTGERFAVLTYGATTKTVSIDEMKAIQLANGNVLAVYKAANAPGCSKQLGASLLDANMGLLQDGIWLGDSGNDKLCSDNLSLSIDALPGGGFALVWGEFSKTYVAHFGDDLHIAKGEVETGIRPFNSLPMGLTTLADGSTIVAGRQEVSFGEPGYPVMNIERRHYNASLAPTTGLLKSSTNSTGQADVALLSTLPDGFLIVYQGEPDQDSDGFGIFMQAFYSDGSKKFKW